MARSILQKDRNKCLICKKNSRADYFSLDEHHVFFGYGVREKSEKYGLKVYLCHQSCHLGGVHADAELDTRLKAWAQKKAMKHYGWTTEDFIRIIGRNYL